MDSKQLKMQRALEKYPEIYNAFNEVIASFSDNNSLVRADRIYDCAEAVVNFIYSNCDAEESDIFFDKLRMMYEAKVITEKSYDNYLSIIDFKHNGSNSEDDEREIVRKLIAELKCFLSDYSFVGKSGVALGKRRITNFFFYRFAGIPCLLIGVGNFYYFFINDYEYMTNAIVGAIFTIFAFMLIFGGKKMAKLILKFRFGEDDII